MVRSVLGSAEAGARHGDSGRQLVSNSQVKNRLAIVSTARVKPSRLAIGSSAAAGPAQHHHFEQAVVEVTQRQPVRRRAYLRAVVGIAGRAPPHG
jgi:hypothetical protein